MASTDNTHTAHCSSAACKYGDPECPVVRSGSKAPFVDLHLTESDVRIMKQALRAYAAHLEPSAGFVPEIRDWYKDVTRVLNRIPDPTGGI